MSKLFFVVTYDGITLNMNFYSVTQIKFCAVHSEGGTCIVTLPGCRQERLQNAWRDVNHAGAICEVARGKDREQFWLGSYSTSQRMTTWVTT